VSTLAEAAARRLGLPASDVRDAARAALVHDLGEMSIPVAAWDKTSPLSDRELGAIRMHPHHTERILSRSSATPLRRLAALAGQHHERVDGSGYYRGTRAPEQHPVARVLAVAEVYQTKLEPRPHREALTPDGAAAEVKRMVREGTLDADAAAAVLEAAGHRTPPVRRERAVGLTPREVEILRLIASGYSAKKIARTLGISVRTAENHTRAVYQKTGVSTRAAAALWAVEHGLIGGAPVSE
jgi:HD-GYP domain-containing protein (c-di-GMP phosphodiesterase class II)